MKEKELVVCPVYNEENTLDQFSEGVRSYYSGDMLFVDDGSTDRGKEILKDIKGNKAFVIRHPKRLGYGAALNSGFRFFLENDYTQIVTLDADLQHDPKIIPSFFDKLTNSEMVIGSRYIKINKSLEAPRDRLLINRYIARLIKLLFQVEFSDPFCGYRAYRSTFLRKINLKEKGYRLSLEILLEAIRIDTVFSELAVEAVYLDYTRMFLDGLDWPQTRLLYYLEIIAAKKREIQNEETFLNRQSSPR